MLVDLRYGRSFFSLEIPANADVTIVRKPEMPVIRDSQKAIRKALAEPVGIPPLELFSEKISTVCIAICDITRPVPNRLFLRPMIETLLQAGVAAANITVLVATGLHRPNEGAELRELVGDSWVLDHIRVVNHLARNDADHVCVGKTRQRGTVVCLDRRFVEADLRIATGLVEPHFMAGYSGGRKVIAPGLAHVDTITTFHNAHFMSHPAATNCNFRDNPLHEEQLEIVRMLGGALALNTVIDENRNLSFVNFGEILESHKKAVDFVRNYCEIDVPRRFPTVVTCAAGYPLDKTYYQTIKGMVGAMDIVEPGGDLIILSECSDGMGSADFVEAQRRMMDLGATRFLESLLQKSHAEIDEWQTQMLLKPKAIGNIHLFSPGLDDVHRKLTGVNWIESVETTLCSVLDRKKDRAVAVIPEGPYVVPTCRDSTGE